MAAETCTWHNDPETGDTWDTDCGGVFQIEDGTPAENSMKFCCFCGKTLITDVTPDGDDDDDSQD